MKSKGMSRRQFLGTATAAASLTVIPVELRAAASMATSSTEPSAIRIASSEKPILFDPDQALGSSMDILSHDVVE